MNRVGAVLVLAAMLTIAGPGVHAQEAQVPVPISLPHVVAGVGEILTIPVQIGDITGLGILATDLLITYDARIITAVRPISSGTFTSGWSQANRVGFVPDTQDTVGLIDIAAATSSKIPKGAGTLLNIEFRVSANAVNGQVTPLRIEEAILNNRSPKTKTQDGSVMVVPVDASGNKVQGLLGDDNVVGLDDFELLVGVYGASSGGDQFEEKYDLDRDGMVGLGDFLLFAINFGREAVN